MNSSSPTFESRAARALAEAWTDHRPVAAPSADHPTMDREAAYAIQRSMVDILRPDLGPRVGWKLGLTARAASTTPMAGPLHAAMCPRAGSRINLATTIVPRLEVELALRVGVDLPEPLGTAALRRLPWEIALAFEVIDDRTTHAATAVDWIADFATMRYAVFGAFVDLPQPSKLGEVAVELVADDAVVADGVCHAVIGEPLEHLDWLAGHLSRHGEMLAAGDVVITGSLTGQHVPTPGVSYVGRSPALPPVALNFENQPAGLRSP